MKTKFFFSLFACLFLQIALFATHNRSGEIQFTQMDQFTVQATVFTYTKESSVAADRDSLIFCWGDGNCEAINRVNGQGNGEVIAFDTKKNIYMATHTYTALGTYKLTMTDPNRNEQVLNIANGNSVNISFHLETELQLKDLNTNEINNSPLLLEPPIDLAFVGQTFVHVPNAFDLDDDSLAYELIVPLQAEGLEVPDYKYPNEIGGSGNSFSIDPETGVLTWSNPDVEGEYNVAILITSYRDGVAIDYTIRDMQIRVEPEGESLPPSETQGYAEYIVNEVGIGDTVRVQLSVPQFDPFLGLEISSTCGLYELFQQDAYLTSVISNESATAEFEWIVREEHRRDQAYQLVIKTQMNFIDYGPTDFAVFRFKVGETVAVPQEPQRLQFSISPNPVDAGSIYLEKEDTELVQYSIYSIIGQLLDHGQLTASDNRIDVQQFDSGPYLLRLEQDGNFGTKTFIVD